MQAPCRLVFTGSPFPFGSGVRGGGDPARGWQLASRRCRLPAGSCLQARVCRLLAGSCLQAPRSHSVAVYEVVGIRAEAGSLHPNEGVAARSSVILVVSRAERGRHGRPVPPCRSRFAVSPIVCALRFQCYPGLTLPFSDVPSVLAVFFSKSYKPRGTSSKKGEKSHFSKTPDFEKVKKTMVKLQKWHFWKIPGVYHRPKLRCHSKTF